MVGMTARAAKRAGTIIVLVFERQKRVDEGADEANVGCSMMCKDEVQPTGYIPLLV